MNGVYNKAVYWPEELQNLLHDVMNKRYKLQTTNHMVDKIAKLRLPTNCYKIVLYGEIIETEIENNVVVKIVTRLPYKFNPAQDICAVIVLDKNKYGNDVARVKTIWTNAHNDHHSSIDESKYVGGRK